MSNNEPFAEPLSVGEQWWLEYGHPFLCDAKYQPTSHLIAMLCQPTSLAHLTFGVESRAELLVSIIAEEIDRRIPVPGT